MLRSIGVVFVVGMVGGLSGLMLLPNADPEWLVIARMPIPDPKPVPCKQQVWPNADRACVTWTAPRADAAEVAAADKKKDTKEGRKRAAERPVIAKPLVVQNAATAEKPAERAMPSRPAVDHVQADARTVVAEVRDDDAPGVVARVLAFFSRAEETKPQAVAPAAAASAPLASHPVIVDLPLESAHAAAATGPAPAAVAPEALPASVSLRPSMPGIIGASPPPVATHAPAVDLLSPQPLGNLDAAPAQFRPRVADTSPAPAPSAAGKPATAARVARSPQRGNRDQARSAEATIAADRSRRTVMARPPSRQDQVYYAPRPQLPIFGGLLPFGRAQ